MTVLAELDAWVAAQIAAWTGPLDWLALEAHFAETAAVPWGVHIVPGLDSEHAVNTVTEPLRVRCQGCNRVGDTERSHRRSAGQGGRWAPSNILRLCRRCHHWAEHNPDAATAPGWRLVHRPNAIPALSPAWCWTPERSWPAWWLIGDDGVYVWLDDDPAPALPTWAESPRRRTA